VKLTVSQLQEVTVFYSNRSFITTFTSAHHRHTHPVHADQSHAFKIQLNILYRSTYRSYKRSPCFAANTVHLCLSFYAFYMPRPSHHFFTLSPELYMVKSINYKAPYQVFFPAYCIFFPVSYKNSVQRPVLKCSWTIRSEVLRAVKAHTFNFCTIHSLHSYNFKMCDNCSYTSNENTVNAPCIINPGIAISSSASCSVRFIREERTFVYIEWEVGRFPEYM
jgi:hypothetical protein